MKLRVLVVDDDPLSLRVTARLLRGLGHGGALASDGDKALRLLAQQSFDLMLLDVNMPRGLSGQDTLARLRHGEPAGVARLPVLMVSGHQDDGTRQFFADAGADGFLVKPLDAGALAGELERLHDLGHF